ncbi:MAG: hypothetical protein HY719_05495 [Planctomycetes bacterium]|nr:hypothetical protein [Planctomycetota bacterium]
MSPEVIDQIAASVVLAALVGGVSLRRRHRLHAAIMCSCFAADLALVLRIEVRAGALAQAAEAAFAPRTLLFWHVLVALLLLALYVVALWLGYRMYTGRRTPWHLRVAVAFFACRLFVFVTSFFLG